MPMLMPLQAAAVVGAAVVAVAAVVEMEDARTTRQAVVRKTRAVEGAETEFQRTWRRWQAE